MSIVLRLRKPVIIYNKEQQIQRRGLQIFSVEGQTVSIFSFFHLSRPYSFYLKYLTLPLQNKSSHRRHVNEGVWLCSSEILFTKRICEKDLVLWPYFPSPCTKGKDLNSLNWYPKTFYNQIYLSFNNHKGTKASQIFLGIKEQVWC